MGLLVLKLILSFIELRDLEILIKEITKVFGYTGDLLTMVKSLGSDPVMFEIVRGLLKSEFEEQELRRYFDKVDVRTTLALILAFLLAKKIGRRAITMLSVRLAKILENYLNELPDSELIKIANLMNISIEYSSQGCYKEVLEYIDFQGNVYKSCLRFRINIFDYLMNIKELLHEPAWQLQNYVIDDGYIYVDSKHKIVRFLSEVIKSRLIQAIDNLGTYVDKYDDELDRLLEELNLKSTERYDFSKPKDRIQGISIMSFDLSNINTLDKLYELAKYTFPPCIMVLLESLLRGENLSHHQRFALASFLINIGIDLELILELFRHSPDFNEKIARYQIEHLAGLRGSRKRYLPYNCDTMRTLGLCNADCSVKNPLVYFRRALTKYLGKGRKDVKH